MYVCTLRYFLPVLSLLRNVNVPLTLYSTSLKEPLQWKNISLAKG